VPKGAHAVADRLDDARKINAQDRRQRLTRVRGLAGPNFDVERIDRAGPDPDQNLPGRGSGLGTCAILNAPLLASRTAACIVFAAVMRPPVTGRTWHIWLLSKVTTAPGEITPA